MAKEYNILGIDEARGCMLVRFTDGAKQHETEVPLPPHLSAAPTDAEIADWVRRFWPHSQMEAQGAAAIESLRNEMVRGQQEFLALATRPRLQGPGHGRDGR